MEERQEKQETSESGSSSSIEPPIDDGEITTISKQITTVTATLIDSYLGRSYEKEKNKSPDLHGFWRWLNATLGSFSLSFAILVFQLLPTGDTGDAFISRLKIVFAESMVFPELLIIWLPLLFMLTGLFILGAVVATSTKTGGPMRLFIMGMVLLALPLIIAGRLV